MNDSKSVKFKKGGSYGLRVFSDELIFPGVLFCNSKG